MTLQYAEQIADLKPVEALLCLEAMSRRVLQIDGEYPKGSTISGVDFYFYNQKYGLGLSLPGTYDTVPIGNEERLELLSDINYLGENILSALNLAEAVEWASSGDRQAVIAHYSECRDPSLLTD